jgi:hypothetical protein
MRPDLAKIEIFNSCDAKLLGEECEEALYEVLADGLLLRELRTFFDGPPVADLLNFRL